MLVLLSQSRLLGSNPIVWLCDQEPVVTAAVTALNLYINVIRTSMILRCTLVQ